MDLFEVITIPFMQRAFLGSIMLAILFGLFGTFIVPRKLGFMADGISHGSLLGIAVGIFIGVYPIIFAIILAAIFGFLLARVNDYGRITQDGLVGIFLAGGMSGAIILLSFMPGYRPELMSYLFGNLLSIQWIDIYGLTLFFVLTIILFRMQWRSLVITTIHTELAYVINLPVTLSKYFLFIGTSIALICGVKLLGIILVSALLIIPVLTANQIGHSFKSTLIGTQICGISCSFMGILFAYILDIPSGPSIALLLVCIFLSAYLYSNVKKHTQGVKI
tara:strand:+ start:407 stop:1237 length:831 start_codon:yes stop_codon:yes gene_type:complete